MINLIVNHKYNNCIVFIMLWTNIYEISLNNCNWSISKVKLFSAKHMTVQMHMPYGTNHDNHRILSFSHFLVGDNNSKQQSQYIVVEYGVSFCLVLGMTSWLCLPDIHRDGYALHLGCMIDTSAGSSPWQREVANARAKSPQSLPPICLCTFFICNFTFFWLVQIMAAICSWTFNGTGLPFQA